MKMHGLATGIAAALTWSGYLHAAAAGTQTAFFDVLNGVATVATPVTAGDTVFLDSLVTGQTGALSQSVTFTLGSAVTELTGEASWAVSTAGGPGPRLVGVNVDLLDVNNTLISSDTNVTVLNGVASSILGGPIGPGTYRCGRSASVSAMRFSTWR